MNVSTKEKNRKSVDCVNKSFDECLDDFAVFAEMIHESIYFINMDGHILYANSAARNLYGYSIDEFLTMSVFDLRREINRESIKQQMKVASMEGILIETKHYKKDNSVIDVLVSSKGTTFGHEKVLISIVRDITERKRTQSLLKESESKFKAAFMTAPDAFFWATLPEGKILEVNDNFESVFGYTREEALGKTSSELGLYANIDDRKKMVEELQNNGFVKELELQGRKKNGVLFSVSLSIRKIEIDHHVFTMGVVKDISDRINAETELRNREIKYHTLFETEEDCILLFTEGHWVDCNKKALELFGCTRDQIIGEHPITFSPPKQPDGRLSDEEAIKLINLAYAGEPQLFKWEHCRADGTPFAAEVSLKRLDLSGKPYIQAIIRDLSDLKNTQDALAYSQELFAKIVESTSDMIWSVDSKNFGLLTFNKALSEYFLQSNIQLKLNMRPEDMHPGLDFKEQWHTFYQQALLNGPYSTEYSRYDGKAQMILTFGLLKNRNGDIYGISVFGKDITQRVLLQEELKKSRDEIKLKLEQTVNLIAKMGEIRDPYTAGHQSRVTQLACAIAEELKLSKEKIELIKYGSTIHDIGKFFIPTDILNKPGKLNDMEFELIKTHPLEGYSIISGIGFAPEILDMVLHHHERLDGTGYPEGISGDKITIESRILAVADVIEAMNSHRPYRPALGIDEALAEVHRFKDIKYDAEVVEASFRLFKEKNFTF
ncbi:MAG: PAS domain S-box protein [Acholeplasma sp.]|jgi:PAS domain S-box-containing protein|nr:MAG: PAS domain S-box protein [Acholeplasma sp.]